MKTIIVPVDFSPAALNAARYALDFAHEIKASITLIYVYQVPVAVSEAPVAAASVNAVIGEAEKRILELKDELIHRCNSKLKIYTEIREGNVTTQVEQYCNKVKPFAVVMGSSGAGKMERILFGSNTLSAIKNLSWPLIIVPLDAKFKSIHKVGMACDLKNVDEVVRAEDIKKLLTEFKPELHILHVSTEKHRISDDEAQGSEQIRDMLSELFPQFHFLNSLNIEAAINRFAGKTKLDMLIVIPKKHGLFESIFHRSESKQMVLNTDLPLLSIHQ